jgi:hypothetical protein
VFLFRSLPTSSLVTLVWNKTKQTLYSVWCASSLIEKSTTKHVGWEGTIGLSNASAQAQQPSSGNLNVKRYWLSKGWWGDPSCCCPSTPFHSLETTSLTHPALSLSPAQSADILV